MPVSRVLFILLVLLLAAPLAACGSEADGAAGEESELLSRALAVPVESGKVDIVAELELDGVPGLADGIRVRANGPFTRRTADLDVSIDGFGPGFAGGLTATDDNLYIGLGGSTYEVGEAFSSKLERKDGAGALGLDAGDWLTDPRVEGDERVGGTATTKVTAGLDVARLFEDLQRLAPRRGKRAHMDPQRFAAFVEDSTVDLYVAKAGGEIRRVVLDLEFEVPEAERDDFRGTEGGAAKADVTFTEVGRPQRIQAPAGAKPLSELLGRFGLDAEHLSR